MAVTSIERDQVREQFQYPIPSDLQVSRVRSVRAAAENLAVAVLNCVPPGADRSAAIRKVREAEMTASAGIVLGPETF